MKRKPLQAADLFCGAGGFTEGAHRSGRVNVALAVNHWRTAIQSHESNHPETRHICARIDDIDPRHDKTLPDLDLLLASPECTHFSIARGGQPVDDQRRATPWHVTLWAECKRTKWIIVENVREFRDWGPLVNKGTERKPILRPDPKHKGEIFRAWIQSIESLGYQVDHQILNAADYGVPQSRNRLFIIARRGRSKKDIPYPDPTHVGRHIPVSTVIDWSKPCPSIFRRKRPLADKTIARIEAGLRKFLGVKEPFVVKLRGSRSGIGAEQVSFLDEPLGTITAGGMHHALAVPFQFKAMGRSPGLTRGIDEPLPTIIAARENHAVVVPYIVPHFGEREGQSPRCHDVDGPSPTITGQGAGSLVVPFIHCLTHGGRAESLNEPMRTITTAQRGERAIVFPFITKYYGQGNVASVDNPCPTCTTHEHFGLAMVSLIQTMKKFGVFDIGFRMLDVDELARAQGFYDGYTLFGTRADQVRQIGNSVCPPVAEALCRTIAEAV